MTKPNTAERKDLQPLPEARTEQVGYAVLGIGTLTIDELLPAFAVGQRSRLAAVVSDDHEKAVATALAYGLTEADAYDYDRFEELQKRDDVHAVYIVLPNSLHRQYTERAARIGKHVLCEKPLAANPEDAEAMVGVCAEHGVKLMTAYRCQYTPHHWRARDLIQNGKLGKIKLIHSVNVQVEPNDGQWRLKDGLAGGGSLLDVGLYCLNTIRFLLAEEPSSVYAQTFSTPGDERFEEVEETVAWQMTFPSGVIAHCSCSYGAAHARTLDVFGVDARLTLDPAFDYTDLRLKVQTPETITEHRLPETDQFALEIDHFSACIEEDREPFTPGEEGLQDQRLMAAIYQSAREGRPIKLEKIEKKDAFRGSPPSQDFAERA